MESDREPGSGEGTVPSISIVVAAFNERPLIETFLRQFDGQSLPRDQVEVIVVDGGSTDGTRPIAERHADRVILQDGEGVGDARNQGVKIARAEIIAITDVDCLVPPRWLEWILEDFRDSDVLAVVGPDGPREDSGRAQVLFWFVRNLIRALTFLGVYTTGGTNTAVRRQAFLEIGGYRPLPHSEDVDFGLRLARKGRIVYDNRLFVRFSSRRMEKYGYMRVLGLWLVSDLRLLVGGAIPPRRYARQSY